MVFNKHQSFIFFKFILFFTILGWVLFISPDIIAQSEDSRSYNQVQTEDPYAVTENKKGLFEGLPDKFKGWFSSQTQYFNTFFGNIKKMLGGASQPTAEPEPPIPPVPLMADFIQINSDFEANCISDNVPDTPKTPKTQMNCQATGTSLPEDPVLPPIVPGNVCGNCDEGGVRSYFNCTGGDGTYCPPGAPHTVGMGSYLGLCWEYSGGRYWLHWTLNLVNAAIADSTIIVNVNGVQVMNQFFGGCSVCNCTWSSRGSTCSGSSNTPVEVQPGQIVSASATILITGACATCRDADPQCGSGGQPPPLGNGTCTAAFPDPNPVTMTIGTSCDTDNHPQPVEVSAAKRIFRPEAVVLDAG